ncbi:TetR/AcrR family transcriptional regulator C-terminal domain-containing protein [Actinoplanes sp. NPDC049265]|uniref:TetR/AcrR family transcriptional regulator C-terminal domain-containing protein n=1 Tax=Actinoplanes sp. NPDC049265 TaxID=3363902 RepID=UPI0037222293
MPPEELPADWREATIAIAHRERAATLRHPWLIDLVTRRSMHGRVGPNMLRHGDQSIAALDSLDADAAAKWRLMAVVADYSTGFAIRERREIAAAGDPELRPYLRKIVAEGDYPHLGPMLEREPAAGDTFERGLRWLLNGFAQDTLSP